MKIVASVAGVFVLLGLLIWFVKRNQKLKDKAEVAKKTVEKQTEITKVYEKQQQKANEVKNKPIGGKVDEETVKDSIDSINDVISSFNKL